MTGPPPRFREMRKKRFHDLIDMLLYIKMHITIVNQFVSICHIHGENKILVLV